MKGSLHHINGKTLQLGFGDKVLMTDEDGVELWTNLGSRKVIRQFVNKVQVRQFELF